MGQRPVLDVSEAELAMNQRLTQFQVGNRLLVKKRYDEALQAFLTHAQEVPAEATRAYVQAAECLRRTNTLEAPVDVEPGVVLVSAGDRAGAAQLYKKALAIDPYYLPALRGLAQVLDVGSSEQVQALEDAVGLKLDPLLVDVLGRIYEGRGNTLRAVALYQRALDKHPNDRGIRDALERVQQSLK